MVLSRNLNFYTALVRTLEYLKASGVHLLDVLEMNVIKEIKTLVINTKRLIHIYLL